jgi:hypothetical protein
VAAPIEALARSLFEALDQIAPLIIAADALKSIVQNPQNPSSPWW